MSRHKHRLSGRDEVLSCATIHSTIGEKLVVRYAGTTKIIALKSGRRVRLNATLSPKK